MADVLSHRGPDDAGAFADARVAIGARRLAILDLSPAARQPFASADGQHVLVFNGEIYNYRELRQQLQSLGHRFRSSGDTEVLLNAYREWGEACLDKLNGMWAFLIYDVRRGVIFGARDRFGVKPLFRSRTPHHVLFASEIKAIRASGLVDSRPNEQLVSEFLTRGTLTALQPGVATFYEEIEQVPAASAFELHLDGRCREWRYWSLADVGNEPVSDPVREFGALFDDAIALRLRSDVPVGVSLSGGLDSTSIICAMAAQDRGTGRNGDAIEAFSFMAPDFDESTYIDATLAQTGATLHRVKLDGIDAWDALPRVLWYHDEPVHSATAIVGYEVYRRAAKAGVKVVLCGQGADESIGGYESYFPDLWLTLIQRGEIEAAWRDIGAYSAMYGGGHFRRFMRAVEREAKRRLSRVAVYRALARWKHRRGKDRSARWFTRELRLARPTPPGAGGTASLDDVLRYSVETAPLPLYLRIEDRNAMANSVEARLPFLDHRLVSLAFRLPIEWRIRGGWNKLVLREAMRGRIPEIVRTRVDKMGFPTPVDRWFRTDLYEPMQDLLASQSVRERGLFRVDAIRADLEQHRRGHLHIGALLFDVAQVEHWLRTVAQPIAQSQHRTRGDRVASTGD